MCYCMIHVQYKSGKSIELETKLDGTSIDEAAGLFAKRLQGAIRDNAPIILTDRGKAMILIVLAEQVEAVSVYEP